jgi:hypothetical protein
MVSIPNVAVDIVDRADDQRGASARSTSKGRGGNKVRRQTKEAPELTRCQQGLHKRATPRKRQWQGQWQQQ